MKTFGWFCVTAITRITEILKWQLFSISLRDCGKNWTTCLSVNALKHAQSITSIIVWLQEKTADKSRHLTEDALCENKSLHFREMYELQFVKVRENCTGIFFTVIHKYDLPSSMYNNIITRSITRYIHVLYSTFKAFQQHNGSHASMLRSLCNVLL